MSKWGNLYRRWQRNTLQLPRRFQRKVLWRLEEHRHFVTPGQCSHFELPEINGKPNVFWCFQGKYKMGTLARNENYLCRYTKIYDSVDIWFSRIPFAEYCLVFLEKILRACVSGTCLFGGTCVEINQYDFRCICPPGRTGKRCASKKIVIY